MALKLRPDWIRFADRADTLRDTPSKRELTATRLRGGPLRLLPGTIVREGVVLEQHIREGRFQRGLALIAGGSALLGGLEVAYEHVIGSYSQRVMYSPVVLSAAVALAGVWSVWDRRVARTLLPLASASLLVDGAVGFVFHIRGVARRSGGWRLPVLNVVMGPPPFAPLLLGISGLLGLIASGLRREDDPAVARLAGLPHWRPARLEAPVGDPTCCRGASLARASRWSSICARGASTSCLPSPLPSQLSSIGWRAASRPQASLHWASLLNVVA
jgi:hypothetical protein